MPRVKKEPSTSASRHAASSIRSAAVSQSTRSKTGGRSTTFKGPTRPKRSTTAKSAAKPSAPARSKRDARQRELQDFAETICKYTTIYQTTAESMWHDPQELRAAGERQYKIALENLSRESKTEEEIQVLLAELAARCEAETKNFDDRVRICFAALAYSQVLMDCVVCHPSRPFNDRVVVFRLIANINRQANNLAPLSSDPPRLVKLIPDAPITRPVTVRDVKRWRAYPKELLRRAFVYHKDEIRRVFLVSDYCVKEIGGHCYELRFEDCGSDVFTFGLEEVLGMVTEAALVTNTQTNA